MTAPTPEQAIALHQAGQVDAAAAAYERLLAADPRQPSLRHNLGMIRLHQRSTARALPLLEQAWAEDGGHDAEPVRLLHQDHVEPEVGHPGSAVLLGDRHRQEPCRSCLGEHGPVDDLVLGPLLPVRDHLPIQERPEGVPEHVVLVGEVVALHC